ncbi:MAG TPA: hypothetical protein VFO86_07920, partial [Terriglobia bacterium]|nr:hypothetical protein [Terriglobia bacterium]
MSHEQQRLTINVPGFTYYDLFKPEKLQELAGIFEKQVQTDAPGLWERFRAYRDAGGKGIPEVEVSDILVE